MTRVQSFDKGSKFRQVDCKSDGRSTDQTNSQGGKGDAVHNSDGCFPQISQAIHISVRQFTDLPGESHICQIIHRTNRHSTDLSDNAQICQAIHRSVRRYRGVPDHSQISRTIYRSARQCTDLPDGTRICQAVHISARQIKDVPDRSQMCPALHAPGFICIEANAQTTMRMPATDMTSRCAATTDVAARKRDRQDIPDSRRPDSCDDGQKERFVIGWCPGCEMWLRDWVQREGAERERWGGEGEREKGHIT